MNVFLLRHAKAEPGSPDAVRELAAKGRRHAADLGRFLAGRNGFEPRHLWVSPLVRARQTAEIVLQSLPAEPALRVVERLEPMADPCPLIDELEAADGDVLVVGHNPNLEILASTMISGERTRAQIHMRTCVIACLARAPEVRAPYSGAFELFWMLDPRLL